MAECCESEGTAARQCEDGLKVARVHHVTLTDRKGQHAQTRTELSYCIIVDQTKLIDKLTNLHPAS